LAGAETRFPVPGRVKQLTAGCEIFAHLDTFRVVRHEGRLWIVPVVWNKKAGVRPTPSEYLPGHTG